MDHHSPIQQEVHVDLESANEEGGLDVSENQAKKVFTKLCDHLVSMDDGLRVDPLEGSQENSVMVFMEEKPEGGKTGEFTANNIGKEKRKKALSAKKPPKPPRPHRGFSLDAADEKLIKELAELAMIKRARIERMKALMQKKASKASSSSNGSLFALLFTIIFFIVLLFQGLSCQKSPGTFEGSPQTAQTQENGLIFIQRGLIPSTHDSISI